MSDSLAIFPLWPVVDGKCTCWNPDCDKAGKCPRVYWKGFGPGRQEFGETGSGIRTGAEFGIFLLDTDFKPEKGIDGEASLASLPPLPETYTVATGGGGLHRYFKYPEGVTIRNSASKIAPGVDIRGENGFAVTEGSVHRNGQKYECLHGSVDEVAEAPAWLIERILLVSPDRIEDVFDYEPVDPESDEGKKRVAQATRTCQKFPPAIQGNNGNGMTCAIASKLTRGLELSVGLAFELIREHYSPRCEPPWEDDELYRLVDNMARTSDLHPGIEVETDFSKFKQLIAPKAHVLPEKKSRRRIKDPNHKPKIKVGDLPGTADEPQKIRYQDIENDLLGHPDWVGVLQLNEFDGKIYAVNPPVAMVGVEKGEDDEESVTAVMRWFFVVKNKEANPVDIRRALPAVARENSYNPVLDYLKALPVPENPEEIFQGLAARLFGDKDEIAEICLRKFFVGAVRRILWPGCQMETMLILCGEQGAFKSSFFRTMFSAPYADGYLGSPLESLDSKDSLLALQARVGVEFQEFDRILAKKDAGGIKAFITTLTDNYRVPYARNTSARPRQGVLAGSSNHLDVLRDPTGARRFWPIQINGMVDIAWVEAHVHDLWASAYQMALRPHTRAPEHEANWHWLTKSEEILLLEKQKGFEAERLWADEIRTMCLGKKLVRVSDILKTLDMGADDSAAKKIGIKKSEVEAILTRLGCRIGRLWDGSKQVRGYLVPDDLATAVPPKDPKNPFATKAAPPTRAAEMPS